MSELRKQYSIKEFEAVYGNLLKRHVTQFGYLQVLNTMDAPDPLHSQYIRLRILDMLIPDIEERMISFCYTNHRFIRIEPDERLLLLDAYMALNHKTDQALDIDYYCVETPNGDMCILNETQFRETQFPRADALYRELSGRSLESDNGKWLEFPMEDQSLGFPLGFPSYYYSN